MPLSVTMMLIALVAGAVGGVQLKKPLLRLMLAPAGAPEARLKESVWGGVSVSVALAKKLRVWPIVRERLVIIASAGAVLGTILLVRGVAVGMKRMFAEPSG